MVLVTRCRSWAGLIVLILLAAFLLCAACTSPGPASPATSSPAASPALLTKGDTLMQKAENEYADSNYRAAGDLFLLAQENYTAEGNPAATLRARDRYTTVMMILYPFPWNRSEAEANVAAAFPDLSVQERTALLDAMKPTALRTDGGIMYSSDTVNNIQFHNLPQIRKRLAAMNHTPIYDEMVPLILHRTGTGSQGEPVIWEGTESVSIPRDRLPATGTFRLWLPLPIEYAYQTNVTITSLEPAKYMKSTTGTTGDIGIVYYEFPLAEMKDPFINATAEFRFTRHEVRFTIDPAKVRPYNTSDPEYRKYMKDSGNIVVTPAMKKKAEVIVGNETNPYLKAQKIYWYIVDTYPYSHAPHSYLDAIRKPESVYMLETGEGDCGTQSMYFAALCRAVGIPARAPGGYQMFEAVPGTHFWSEYYLEGYGWIPNDVTAAEGGDWSYNATPDDRHRYKEYFSQNLDPYRYVIQKNVDAPLVPAITRTFTNDMAFQEPRAECDTCTEDPIFWIAESMTITMDRV